MASASLPAPDWEARYDLLPARRGLRTWPRFGRVEAQALRRAAAAHGEHEARTGKHDQNWPDWYAEYLVREQSGEELPV
jgi:hypothetical protein